MSLRRKCFCNLYLLRPCDNPSDPEGCPGGEDIVVSNNLVDHIGKTVRINDICYQVLGEAVDCPEEVVEVTIQATYDECEKCCQREDVHFSGVLMGGTFVSGWLSKVFTNDQYSNFVSPGEYPSNSTDRKSVV